MTLALVREKIMTKESTAERNLSPLGAEATVGG